MTTQYQCNKCHRTTSVPYNKSGFDTFSRCIITDQCTGTLFFVKRNDNILRDVPTSHSKYKDWIERRQLFNFVQPTPSSIWRIKHTLNSQNLLFYVYTYVDTDLLIASNTDYTITTVDNNYLEIHFNNNVSGEVQLESHNTIVTPTIEPEQYIRVTTNGMLTVATHSHDTISYLPSIKINGIVRSNENNNGFLLGFNTTNPTWGDCSSIYVHGNNYNVSTINLTLNDPDPRNDNVYSIERVADGRLALVLLSNGANFYDKVYNKMVDLNDLRLDNNYIKNNDLYCKESIIKQCFPTIIQN